jgi:hypothetical protein
LAKLTDYLSRRGHQSLSTGDVIILESSFGNQIYQVIHTVHVGELNQHAHAVTHITTMLVGI